MATDTVKTKKKNIEKSFGNKLLAENVSETKKNPSKIFQPTTDCHIKIWSPKENIGNKKKS